MGERTTLVTDQWPILPNQYIQNLPELKSTVFVSQPSLDLDPEYFTKNYVLTWIRRFISNCCLSFELRNFDPVLSVAEIDDTKNDVVQK